MADYADRFDDKKSDSDVKVHNQRIGTEHDFEKSAPSHHQNVEQITGIDYDDPNLDPDAIGDYEDDSPYPEVRAAVANTDDTSMPVNTFRAWVIGLLWAIVIPGLNQ